MTRVFQGLGIVTATLMLCVTGCTRSTAPVEAAKKPRLGFVLATLNEERYQKDREYFLAQAAALGAEVVFAACDNNVSLQTSRVENLLAKGIDVLVIQPVHSEAASAIAKSAKADGVPVIAYDRLIRNAPLDLYVTQNSFQVGADQAEEAVKALGGKGNVVILSGEAGHSVAEEITRGNRAVLEKSPGMKIVAQQSHPGWSTSAALATVENALTRFGNRIDAVLANNDGMALGAVKALEEQGLAGKAFVAGADADLTAVRNILAGRQTMTVLKGIKPLAEAAAKAAVQIARGEKPATDATMENGQGPVPTLNTPVEKVLRGNLQEVIVGSGFHSQAAVFGPGKT